MIDLKTCHTGKKYVFVFFFSVHLCKGKGTIMQSPKQQLVLFYNFQQYVIFLTELQYENTKLKERTIPPLVVEEYQVVHQLLHQQTS